MTCPLCEVAQGKNITTDVHYPLLHEAGETDWIVLDCKTCGVPIAVFHKHTTTLTIRELGRFKSIIEVLWPRDKWDYEIRFHARTVMDHIHFHILNLRRKNDKAN